MSAAVRQKDPGSSVNFTLDYTDHLLELGGLTITGSTWLLPSGITEVASGFTASSATIRVSGGSHGSDYELINNFVLSDGQSDSEVLVIQVREKESGSSADATNRAQALDALSYLAEMDDAPQLTEDEIERALNNSKLALTWTPSTAYNIGDVMVPPVRDGHAYECVRAGTSDSATFLNPSWPIRSGMCISDGNVLVWEECGSDLFNPGIAGNERNTYDINKAAKMCWEKKARRSAQMVADGDIAFDQIHKHCVEEAEKFYPFRRAIQLIRC